MSQRLRQTLSRAAALAALASLGAGPAVQAAAPPAAADAQLAGRPFPRSTLQPSRTTSPAPPPVAIDRAPYAPSITGAPEAEADGGRVVHVGTGSGASRTLAIPRGKSATVELPVDAGDVLVSDPKIADVVLSTPRRIQIMGLQSGQTDAQFVDGMGRRILHLDIRVDQDAGAAAQTIASLLPGTRVKVSSANGNLILSGEAANASEADRAMRLASSFVTAPNTVVNLINVAGGEQVMLKVKIVEVNRTVLKQLGFDLGAVTGQLGMPQYSFLKSPTYGVNGSYLGTLNGGYAVNTTSQPTSAYAGLANIPGLSQVAGLLQGASAVGIPTASIGQYISSFLTGLGTTLTPAQSTYASNYVAGVLASTSTQITPNVLVNGVPTAGAPYTATASLVGITTSNVGQLERDFINGTGNLTNEQRLYLNAFNTNLAQSYNAANQYSLGGAQSSTYVDRSNPANPIQTGRAGSPGLNQANGMIQAFERVGLVRTLAEPNLTAVSGESGHFLVGGEFPVPTSQDTEGRVSISFKPYGVGLGYTPVVLSSGRISLKISTEVSELTNVGGFTLNTSTSTNGTAVSGPSLVVPGLNVRRAETTVELPSGGALMIAGLVQSQTKETLDSLPGLMQLPILGSLLRSRDFQNNETELVIIVTPYLVKAVRPDELATPADGLKIASDVETNLLGRLNTGFGKTAPAPTDKTYQGPFGYVVD